LTAHYPSEVRQGIHITYDAENRQYANVPRCLVGAIPESATKSIVENSAIDKTLLLKLTVSFLYPITLLLRYDLSRDPGEQNLPPEWTNVLEHVPRAEAPPPPPAQPASAAVSPPKPPEITPEDPHTFLEREERINAGSTCVVYSAFHPALNRVIALKEMLLRPNNERLLLEEALLMASMDHPNIIKAYSAHRIEHTLWIVMELMDGGCLTSVAHYGEVNEHHIAYFVREVLQALDYMHRQNKIHRDIKTQTGWHRK
jgi:p21-activated kinase 1